METEERKKYYKEKNWSGLKKYIKKFLLQKYINIVIVAIARYTIPMHVRKRIPINRKEVDVRIEDKKFVMMDPAQCSIAKGIAWNNGELWDEKSRFALNLFCKIAKECDHVIDIGANTGLFSLAVATLKPSLRVESYEIVPDVFATLYKNICRNNLLRTITPSCKGIGLTGTFHKMPFKCKDSSLPSSFSTNWSFTKGVDIPFISLDEMIYRFTRSKKILIKIDVEGTEDKIFKNAQKFLSVFKPDILCEIQTWAQDTKLVQKVFKELSYFFYNIQDGSLKLIGNINANNIYHDWFITKKTKTEMSRYCDVE